MTRVLALAYGVVCYVVFLGVFLYGIAFIGNLPVIPKTIDTRAVDFTAAALAINVVLLGVFAIQHSVMARQGFKRMWTRIVPQPVERSTFVLFSTAALALVLWQWRAIGGTVWEVTAPWAVATLWTLYGLGWALLLTATFLIDHFDLFGLRQVVLFALGRAYRPPDFKIRGYYRFVRHPIMLGFLIGTWSAPLMTLGHLIFAVGITGYIFVGVTFEERDLVEFYGEKYRAYRARVPMIIPGLGRSSRRGTASQVS